MSERKDGGPAFPGPTWQINEAGIPLPDQEGMTLRDYFAAKAMQKSMDEFFTVCREGNPCPEGWMLGVAMDAYAMADAMLKARDANHG